MKKQVTKIGLALLVIMSVALTSCEQENEDIVKAPNKDGSVETIIKINHEKDFDVLSTTHLVWVKNKQVKSITKIDTLPSLGNTTQEGENDEGETKQITLPKNYELYITVK